MKPARCSSQNGFTLLEVLVALTVLAVMAAGFMTVATRSLQQEHYLELKTYAGWVAENRLAELRSARIWSDGSVSDETVSMAGQQWNMRVTIQTTPNPDIRKVKVDVSLPAIKVICRLFQ